MVGCLLRAWRRSQRTPRTPLIDHDLLLVLVDRRDPHLARQQHVRLAARLTLLVDPLPHGEVLEFHLGGQHRPLILVEQREERHICERIGIQAI